MKLLAYSRPVLRWLSVMLVAALTTFVLVWMGANSTAAAMVFLVLVVWSATQTASLFRSLSPSSARSRSTYFFLPPYRTLRLQAAQEWVAMVSFVASCVVVGRVAEMARRQTRQAEQRREDVERLYALSQEMMLHEDAAGLIRDLPRLIDRIFALEAWCCLSATRTSSIPRPRIAGEYAGQSSFDDHGDASHAGWSGRRHYRDGADAGVATRRSTGLATGKALA